MNRVKQKLEEIDRIKDEQDRLRLELDRSLALQEIWPEVFNKGKARSQWVVRGGGPLGHARRSLKGWDDFAVMYVYDGEGNKKSFKPSQVPNVLLHADIRKLLVIR